MCSTLLKKWYQMISMKDFYIFDIAVYLKDEDAYYKNMNNHINNNLNKTFISRGLTREKNPEVFMSRTDDIRKSYGGAWDFNQIVGWIRLYAEPSHIGAHLWWVQGKKLQRRMSKTFYLMTTSNFLATYFYPEDDSNKIFNDTLADIKWLSKESLFKGRHIDLEPFTRIGTFVDWRGLLNSRSKR